METVKAGIYSSMTFESVTFTPKVREINGTSILKTANLNTLMFEGSPALIVGDPFIGVTAIGLYHAGMGWTEEVREAYGGNITLVQMVDIVVQPQSVTVSKAGTSASTSISAIGEGLAYTWYYKNPGSSAFAKGSVKTSDYTAKITAGNSGRQVYCVVTDRYGNTIQSDTVTLSIKPEITKQPENMTAAAGTSVTTSVTAEGDGLKYAWYYKNAGSTKFSKGTVTTNVYASKLTSASNGRQVYCVVTDKYGNSVQSEIVTMKIG